MIASLRSTSLALALLGFQVAALATLAETAQAQEEARVLFERGNEHLARGLRARGRSRERELTEALDAYLGVLRLGARTRNVVFNIGLALSELGRDQEAFNYFSEYLRTPELSDDERAEGTRRRDALRARVAVIVVESTPPGAEVRIGRRDLPVRGTTPIEIAVEPGAVRVFFSYAGHADASVDANASIGGSEHVRAELAPEPVQVQVIAPSTGTLTLDGEPIVAGRTTPVAPGSHVVRLEMAGMPPIERHFEVAPGSEPLVLTLSAPSAPPRSVEAPRIAMVIDTPAEVFVDGVRVGRGARLEIPSSPGSHELRVSAPGHRPLVHEVSLEADQRLQLHVDLGVEANPAGIYAARTIFAVLAIGGIAASIGLGALALDANDRFGPLYNAYMALPPNERPQAQYDELTRLSAEIEMYALAFDLTLAATAVLGVVAFALLFVDEGRSEDSTVQVRASIGPGMLRAELAWRGL